MASVNKVILVGNLGADSETRYTPGGDPVCNLRLATTEKHRDKSGSNQETTEWHRVVLYRRLAEIAEQYLRKGATVYFEGRLKTRQWQDKTGQARSTTEIEASEMKMLGGGTRSETQTEAQSRGKAVLAKARQPDPWETAPKAHDDYGLRDLADEACPHLEPDHPEQRPQGHRPRRPDAKGAGE